MASSAMTKMNASQKMPHLRSRIQWPTSRFGLEKKASPRTLVARLLLLRCSHGSCKKQGKDSAVRRDFQPRKRFQARFTIPTIGLPKMTQTSPTYAIHHSCLRSPMPPERWDGYATAYWLKRRGRSERSTSSVSPDADYVELHDQRPRRRARNRNRRAFTKCVMTSRSFISFRPGLPDAPGRKNRVESRKPPIKTPTTSPSATRRASQRVCKSISRRP